ncbi:3-methyl-2-oxobutanoate hydroxymethyltransferase [Legionella sp. W05-934-2]|jgi:3-methyl-2-oxobutanoate hydroxymethyltransferase|uniref:3-methyl-2-oxobutanoate hydroxymethyltransferase n=1 Tax=Legionella sp. W05-934-2 TaxID=1198649 RepID=UPI0034626F1B
MRQVPFSGKRKPKTIHYFQQQKDNHTPLCLVTCYDYPSAVIVANTDIDAVLVGDSVAMVVHGYDTTVMATMPMMVMHTRAVARGLGSQLLIADLPFLSYRQSLADTVDACRQLMQAGAHAIKLEGADIDALTSISHLVKSGIPIMGHIGLTPQSVHQLGGHRVQGKSEKEAMHLIEQAKALVEVGCFALVLECVPEDLAYKIQQTVSIPLIGIGAGPGCDGQILVWHDLLGLQNQNKPKFVKEYVQAGEFIQSGLEQFCHDVRKSQFPLEEHSYAGG